VTTTSAAIRDLMRTTVAGLTPSVMAADRFRAHREEQGPPFRIWCEANPQAALRLFSIRDLGAIESPALTNADVELVSTEFEAVVCYPNDSRYGRTGQIGQDDVIEADQRQIDRAIGTTGYATLDTTTGGAAVVVTRTVSRELANACTFLSIRFAVQYWRSLT
jgi:hypothetical protein